MLRYVRILALLSVGSLSLPLFGGEAIESSLKKALFTLKQQQEEKTRSAVANLAEQVRSDMEPAKRLQASLMLAAHYWETNYRLSRYYLGIAEALRNPTSPELSAYDSEIEHMKVRFRQAALLDQGTKRELEVQLKAKPAEPIRLSLVEMLLATNDALGLNDDYLTTFKTYYSAYPRLIRKDRFIKRVVAIYQQKKDAPNYYKQLESLLDQYPVTDEAKWALEQLLEHSKGAEASLPRYAFTYGLLKKVYRNSSHDPAQQQRVLELMATPLRKQSDAPALALDAVETIRIYCHLQLFPEALAFAQTQLTKPETPVAKRQELQNWIAFIYSERGDHSAALVQYQSPIARPAGDLMFQESEAKSYMSSQNFAAAAQHYQALMHKKDGPRYRWYYFWNLMASGRTENAQTFASRQPDRMFNELEFKSDAALYWQAKAWLSAGKVEKAEPMLHRLFERPNPGYYGVLAKSALAEGLALASKQNQKLAEAAAGSGDAESQPVTEENLLAAKPMLAAYRAPGEGAEAAPLRERLDEFPLVKNVFEIAKTMEIDPFLVLSIVHSESAFNARALSAAGAQGLMQIMPYTAVRLARMLDDKEFRLDQLQSSDMNLVYGSLYLALLLNYYGGHAIPAVAAYNAGPNVVNKWLGECRNCPVDAFVEFIPYAETRNYVKKVMSTYTGYRLNETRSMPEFVHQNLPSDFSKQPSIF